MTIPLRVALGLLLLAMELGGPPPAHADEVPYIQTPANVVDAMLSIAEVGPRDYVIDLGSGDGRIVIAAAKRYRARGLGIELDNWLVAQSRANAAREGVSSRAQFLHQDIFRADFRAATVLTMYLLPEVNLDLRPRILFELRAGTRIVSHDWDMGDWESDRRLVIQAPDKTIGLERESTVYLWIVPARVAGYWRGVLAGPGGKESVVVEFAQRFQHATATVWLRRWTLAGSGRIRGNTLALSLERLPWMAGSEPLRFSLRVAAGRLEGEAVDGGQRYVLRARRLVE
ncbi:MAG TPA: class I SAM-dependent methyltransferase [Candidatus Methylomirabilis sp.]|nr:class I SAM-dependent methyltransferase [Candidatus Methylomirabilis sp.]HSB82069.1 class I SAM-dependent methyltransferase [Candidatus Methylomirabilis sp.]